MKNPQLYLLDEKELMKIVEVCEAQALAIEKLVRDCRLARPSQSTGHDDRTDDFDPITTDLF